MPTVLDNYQNGSRIWKFSLIRRNKIWKVPNPKCTWECLFRKRQQARRISKFGKLNRNARRSCSTQCPRPFRARIRAHQNQDKIFWTSVGWARVGIVGVGAWLIRRLWGPIIKIKMEENLLRVILIKTWKNFISHFESLGPLPFRIGGKVPSH